MIRIFAIIAILTFSAWDAHAGMMRDIVNAIPVPTGGGGSVTLDANATAPIDGFETSPLTSSNLTVGSGANRCLVAQLNFFNATQSAVSMTWNGVSMTQIGNEGGTYLFGLTNPASGNNSLVATWTGGGFFMAINATSFTNCNQTFASAFINVGTATGTSTTISNSITNPSGNIAIDSMASLQVPSAPTQTQLYLDNVNSFTGSSYSTGVNPTFGWTQSGTGTWYDVAASIAHP